MYSRSHLLTFTYGNYAKYNQEYNKHDPFGYILHSINFSVFYTLAPLKLKYLSNSLNTETYAPESCVVEIGDATANTAATEQEYDASNEREHWYNLRLRIFYTR